MFAVLDGALVFKKAHETVRIEPWGTNALRVRATMDAGFTGADWALTEGIPHGEAVIAVEPESERAPAGATITNGRLAARVSGNGVLRFYKDGELVLSEYHRNYDSAASKESICLKVVSREFKGILNGEYRLAARFNATDGERLYGMGQYQMPYLDLKGCTLELAQRNSQVSVPFALSSLGYGFLWNNPAVGRATFGKNITEWSADCTRELDYWITVGDTPKEIIRSYTAAVGRTPRFPKELLGFWQCKLRYRTQDEVLSVARRYRDLGIRLSVIVIDFFHWVRQGDWGFDKEYWPDPKAMCEELHEMGTKVMVSVWPSVDKKSVNFPRMADEGLLVRTNRGSDETYDYQGDCITFDATNPAAREFVWDVCRKNYLDAGIDCFWLDNAEPDMVRYDFDNIRYHLGNGAAVSNLYPKCFARVFFDGMTAAGKSGFVNLERSTWVGGQKYATVLWNGDVQSTWECLRDSVAQGLNMGIAGIPWWTTDIGGFMGSDTDDPAFIELLERWFEFAVFTPVMRLHGERGPKDVPRLVDDERDWGGGFLFTGRPNEIWSYGEGTEALMVKNIRLRESLAPYIAGVLDEASETGVPAMRALFVEFPHDENCFERADEYMFGGEYLVAPVLAPGVTARAVYLPLLESGAWENTHTGERFSGGLTVQAPAPRDAIPVFRRISS